MTVTTQKLINDMRQKGKISNFFLKCRRVLVNTTRAAICAALLTGSSFSVANATTIGTDWVLYGETDGVKTYYEITQCDGKNVVFIHFVNTNTYKVNVEWNDEIQSMDQWVNTSGNGNKSVNIDSEGSVENSCNNIVAAQNAIYSAQFVSMPNPKITGVKVNNLKVTKL